MVKAFGVLQLKSHREQRCAMSSGRQSPGYATTYNFRICMDIKLAKSLGQHAVMGRFWVGLLVRALLPCLLQVGGGGGCSDQVGNA